MNSDLFSKRLIELSSNIDDPIPISVDGKAFESTQHAEIKNLIRNTLFRTISPLIKKTLCRTWPDLSST